MNNLDPRLLTMKADATDNPTWSQAMTGPDEGGFWDACQDELSTLVEMKAWEVMDRNPTMKVLGSTWAFKRKRYPDGRVRKLKARFCVRGDQQIDGVDVFDTFAPVAQWVTIRIMLLMSIVLELVTVQVDYIAAFLHAPIKEYVYINMPRGFQIPGKVLKLNKSLYGLKQSPRNFYNHLKDKLLK